MLNRWIETEGLLDTLDRQGIGCITFTALAQGILTDKYLNGVPQDARVNRPGGGSLLASHLSEDNLRRVRGLNDIARARGQSLAQMALAWVLRDPRITSTLIGASNSAQIRENIAALDQLAFSDDELRAIDALAQEGGINLWAGSSGSKA
jgi:L-glyceraldehyde 3-phosphate reductase